MKKSFLLPFILAGSCLTATLLFVLYQKQNKSIQVLYDANIENLPINTLKNLRYQSEQEKKKLFESFASIGSFKIENICQKLQLISNPDIIIWFTDHFGAIPQAGLDWYKKNIFDLCAQPNATFWLTDLSAWRFLSIKEKDLLACPDFACFMELSKEKRCLEPDKCPLINDSSIVLPSALESDYYKILKSNDFFIWLAALDSSIQDMDPTIVDKLIREDIRSGAAHFTLKEIGYAIPFLDYYSKKLQQNLLDIDQTQIFPLLQYLEALYYVLKIIDYRAAEGNNDCRIVFLLPNKEFTYYLVEDEKRLFETFAKHLSWFLQKGRLKDKVKVTLYFYPFSYGSGFYDQPYGETEPFVKTEIELFQQLIAA